MTKHSFKELNYTAKLKVHIVHDQLDIEGRKFSILKNTPVLVRYYSTAYKHALASVDIAGRAFNFDVMDCELKDLECLARIH